MSPSVFMKSLIAVLLFSGGVYAFGDEALLLRQETDKLIAKLQYVYSSLDENSQNQTERAALGMRLADLLSDRARFTAQAELDTDCTKCEGAKKERELAIDLYLKGIPFSVEPQKSRAEIQVGHLYELNLQSKLAEDFYLQVLNRDTADSESRAEAALSLAEMKYRDHQYSQAKIYYQKTKAFGQGMSGFAVYREAWCELNLGHEKMAVEILESLLADTKLLHKSPKNIAETKDLTFHEEVSRDYASFLARTNELGKKWQQVWSYSPETTRITNLSYLGNEADRLGRHQESAQIWKFLSEQEAKLENKTEAYIRLAQIYYLDGNYELSEQYFSKALQGNINLNACSSELCLQNRRVLREVLFSWLQREKTFRAGTIRSLELFLAAHPKDLDANIAMAESFAAEKNSVKTSIYFETAIAEIVKSGSKSPADLQKLDACLLKNFETATASSDLVLQDRAIKLYLDHSPTKLREFEMKYQQAYIQYQKADYSLAAESMLALTRNVAGPEKLRKQAADLALDSAVLAKDTEKISALSTEFAQLFPAHSKEFYQIKQKAILNKMVQYAQTNDAAAWALVNQFSIDQADAGDKLSFLKNKILLSIRMQNWISAKETAKLLLAQNISAPEREIVLNQLLFAAEQSFDFALAFQTAKQINWSQSQPPLGSDEVALKMAYYAELAEQNPRPYLEVYLEKTQSEGGRKKVLSQILKDSKNPQQDIQKRASLLKRYPEILGEFYLVSFSRDSSKKVLNQALNDLGMVKEDRATAYFKQLVFLENFQGFADKIKSHMLISKSQSSLNRTLLERTKFLEQLDKRASEALEMKQWTSQVLAVSVVASENQRFYDELVSLPVPQGLSDEEQSQYLQLLSEKAQPYLQKAQMAHSKVSEFWKSNWKDTFEAQIQQDGGALLKKEITYLQKVAPEDRVAELSLLAQKTQSFTPQVQVDLSRRSQLLEMLKKNPQDQVMLLELHELEKVSAQITGHTALLTFLESKMSSHGGEKL